MRTIDELRMLQALPLELKVAKTKLRIREWVNQFGVEGVYVAFSGGKDSTVLLHIVRQLYPEVEAVFVNTGLEYPEIQRFVKTFDNVTILRPKMRFDEVIKTYGYPVISKDVAQSIHDVRTQADIRGISVTKTKMYDRYFNPESDYAKKYPSFSRAKWDALFDMPFKMSHKCCDVMKKAPTKQHEKLTGKKPMLATMASESRLRQTKWLAFGCNAFEQNRPTSQPMSFWTEQDVLQYIKQNNLDKQEFLFLKVRFELVVFHLFELIFLDLFLNTYLVHQQMKYVPPLN